LALTFESKLPVVEVICAGAHHTLTQSLRLDFEESEKNWIEGVVL
jgi:hypothetical protein